MEQFLENIVSKSPDEIERMRLLEMPFLMNVCKDDINDMFIHKACKNDSTFWVKRFLTKFFLPINSPFMFHAYLETCMGHVSGMIWT